MLESIITIAGAVGIGIWMYKKGYKAGYDKGAEDGYNALWGTYDGHFIDE